MEPKKPITREKLLALVVKITVYIATSLLLRWLLQFLPERVRPLVVAVFLFAAFLALYIALIVVKKKTLSYSYKVLFGGFIGAFAILSLWQAYAYFWNTRVQLIGIVALFGIPIAAYQLSTRYGKQKDGEVNAHASIPVDTKKSFKLILISLIAIVLMGLSVTGWLSIVPCLFQTGYAPIDKHKLRGTGQLVFIPLDDFPQDRARVLAQYYWDKYGVAIEVTSPIALPKIMFDEARKQYVAESMIAFLRSEPLLSNPESIKIALTDRDIYIKSYSWGYAFSYREAPIAVVSSARMDHGLFGLGSASPERQASRFRKMLTKNIGVLYYHLPFSEYCRSVMYGNIGGPQELDVMGEDF